MPSEIGIIVLHGIGRHFEGYYEELSDGLNRELNALDVPDRRISGFLYSDIAQPNQDRYWNALNPDSISMNRFREVFLNYFGDAGTYGIQPGHPKSNYRMIHARLEQFLAEELQRLSRQGRLIVIAHSFGAHVFSNFIWDYQKRYVKPRRLREFPGRFRLFITTGCNIPVIVAGLEKPQPFSQPNRDFRWVNIYDRDDVLGWPVKPLGGDFAGDNFISDRIVDSGLPVLSHMKYWKSRHSLAMMAEEIAASVRQGII